VEPQLVEAEFEVLKIGFLIEGIGSLGSLLFPTIPVMASVIIFLSFEGVLSILFII
jgi:hypothetical protein